MLCRSYGAGVRAGATWPWRAAEIWAKKLGIRAGDDFPRLEKTKEAWDSPRGFGSAGRFKANTGRMFHERESSISARRHVPRQPSRHPAVPSSQAHGRKRKAEQSNAEQRAAAGSTAAALPQAGAGPWSGTSLRHGLPARLAAPRTGCPLLIYRPGPCSGELRPSCARRPCTPVSRALRRGWASDTCLGSKPGLQAGGTDVCAAVPARCREMPHAGIRGAPAVRRPGREVPGCFQCTVAPMASALLVRSVFIGPFIDHAATDH